LRPFVLERRTLLFCDPVSLFLVGVKAISVITVISIASTTSELFTKVRIALSLPQGRFMQVIRRSRARTSFILEIDSVCLAFRASAFGAVKRRLLASHVVLGVGRSTVLRSSAKQISRNP
ncbi:hypothetical protein KCU73_g31, partial [Aureobasidium melanogenum]